MGKPGRVKVKDKLGEAMDRKITHWADTPAFNVLGVVQRESPGTLKIVYRFRYDGSDPRPFEGNDKKNWYTFTTQEPEAEAIEKVLGPFRMMAAHCGQPLEFIWMKNGNVDAFMNELGGKSWSHMRLEKSPISKSSPNNEPPSPS